MKIGRRKEANRRILKRFQYMSCFTLVVIAWQFMMSDENVVDAKIKDRDFEGPYWWDGEEYDMFRRIYQKGGFIDEYTNKETFCTSYIYHPGLSLLGDGVLGFLYLLFLFWMFIGISILADIFMEAIE